MTVREQWDGGEWQEHCRMLLGMKYAENIQFIPDRVDGDGGLEAFRLDCCTVYQCYAPKDAFTVEAQTYAQKNKIKRDIYKLVSKPEEVAALLGKGYLIRRWVLLTPEYDDKEIVRYAREKSYKTRFPSRPKWCDEKFDILVATDRDLLSAQLATLGDSIGAIKLHISEMAEKDAYASIDQGVAAKLTEKLRVSPMLSSNEENLARYRSGTLLDYVYGRSQLEILQDRYSAAYALVDYRARMTLRRLPRRLAAISSDPAGLEALVQELATAFAMDVPALPRMACEDLANYFIAAWWIECPLHFQVAA